MTPPAAPLGHEAILASAGSGKTFALVTRYLQLLAHGQPPERIVALTFTRKAAGEFFDKILQRLAAAALDPAARDRLGSDLGRAGLDRDEVIGWLRMLIDRLPLLTLGTLDSFFIRMVSAFALEFGLGGPFRLLEGSDIEREREALCRVVFQALPPDRQHEQQELINAFDQATFGVEEKSLHRAFDSFIEAHHHAWQLDPVPEKWGHPAAIWPVLPWYLGQRADGADGLLDTFLAALESLKLQPRQKKKLTELAESLAAHVPGTAASKKFDYLRDTVLPSLDALRAGSATLKIYAPLTLEGEASRTFAALIGRYLAGEVVTLLKRTTGLASLLRDYEAHHEASVRRQGRLTFDDVKFLLARGGPDGDGVARLAVDARLDARFDHWLIDEFQDTSLLQWGVLRPLVEEALEDPQGGRTYFQVGDEKQSIYRWRGGEPELGRHIIDRYHLPTRPLNESWRSAPAVIEAVNAVFGDEEAVRSVVPPATADRWRAGWTAHTTRHRDRVGCAALIRPPEVVEGDEVAPVAEMPPDTEMSPFERELSVVASLLREIQPLARGLTVALLLRGNDEVAQAVDFLRRQDGLPPIVSETDASVAVDNPLTLALLSLLRAAAHPGDAMAWEHVRMTPLAGLWAAEESPQGKVAWQVLQEVLEKGFEAWVVAWTARLESNLAVDDEFSRLRGAQLADLAREFDARGSRDIDAFLRSAESATARETAGLAAVQVMTIHKSKGLDFDIVILPRLAGKSFHDDSRDLLLRSRDDGFETRWVVRRPPGELTAADPVLRAAREASQAAQAYEGLCVFYVAMTRAKHALYLVGQAGKGDGSARHAAALVERALVADDPPEPMAADGHLYDCGWLAGEPRWFESMPLVSTPAALAPAPSVFVPTGPGRRARSRLTPSGKESHVLTADQMFSPSASPARDLGTLVHALFERIEHPDDSRAAHAWWQSEFPQPVGWQSEAWRQVSACLADPAVRATLEVPAGTSLWREKRFEIILHDEWVTGTFDRVLVGPDHAVIIDFKTDGVADPAAAIARAAGYRPQIDLYRQVLARLTTLPPDSIRAALVFTRPRWVVPLDDQQQS